MLRLFNWFAQLGTDHALDGGVGAVRAAFDAFFNVILAFNLDPGIGQGVDYRGGEGNAP